MSFGGSAFGASTTAAPGSTTIFGQSTASKPAGSLFGSTQPTTSTFTGFGQPQQQQQTQQPAQGISLFGGGQQQQQPTTSMFGQPANTQAAPGTSLFGGTTQSQTTPGTSLFGGTAQQPQPQGTGTSLFGGMTPQPQSTVGTSLFGGAQQQQQQQQQQPQGTTGTSSFGTTQQQQSQPTAGTSLFGSTAQPSAPTQPTTGLFGGQQPAQQGLFSSTLQPQPTLPALGTGSTTTGPSLFGVQQSISPVQPTGQVLFSRSTKFNDLPEDIKKKFEALDAHIHGRIQISNDLKQRKLGQEPTKGQELIREVHKELLSVTSMIQADAQFIRDLKAKTEQAVQDTVAAIPHHRWLQEPTATHRLLEKLCLVPVGVRISTRADSSRADWIPTPRFFTRMSKEMQERLQWCKNTIEQIERKLSSTVTQQQNTPQAIASALQTQHAVFVSLAAKTATVDAELQKLKALYTQLWRARTGSVRDPFNDLDRGNGSDFGMESLQVK
ncbi:hypothetical protein F5J12DRAFT_831836 [Pisolithus orientalis]|uniref:uncharacterized protein n=1 Tax=Pisolithus orientalis TaxID=936130 RepID=UPI0022255D49|nr:uncharacterized protein F5J12DRAFT_831836 [Pisolithus orientalis]KAI6006610.1 hypothetical protein F5J12DRAFT_831836 [Pisolithus orientalis]